MALGNLVILVSSSIQVIEFPALTEVRGLAGFAELPITTLDLPALTYARGFFLTDDDLLARLILPELRIVEFNSDFFVSFDVRDNNLLTYLSIPKLTYIIVIQICGNGVGLVVPNALDMTASVGGLVVTGPYKGTSTCYIQNGSDSCVATTCP